MDVLIKPFNDDYFSVNFPGKFNEVLLNAVRNVPDRRWNNEQKIWLIPNSEAAKQALLENLYETGEFSDKAAGSGGSAFLLPQRAA